MESEAGEKAREAKEQSSRGPIPLPSLKFRKDSMMSEEAERANFNGSDVAAERVNKDGFYVNPNYRKTEAVYGTTVEEERAAKQAADKKAADKKAADKKAAEESADPAVQKLHKKMADSFRQQQQPGHFRWPSGA